MPPRQIHLAKGLSVNAEEVATQVVAALGMRGSGKSSVMTVICEGLLAAKIQVVILDYVGIHFGLRLAPDGKRPSAFEIPVLGGAHGDLAILPTAGTVIAEALAASGSPTVLDISGFSKGDRVRFATDFAEVFFDAKKKHPGPCFLVLEEAQRYVPQVIRWRGTGLERCLGAFEEIAEVGRNYGIGLGLISQRPQKINKDVLNLCELLFAFQANGVHERKAVAEWVQEKGAEGREDVMGELPGLRRGQDGIAEAIVWSPSWLKVYGKHVFHNKTTYDAGRTPTGARAAVKVRPLDLAALEAAMAEVVARAKENDPQALKAEVVRLKRELERASRGGAASKIREIPIIPDAVVASVTAIAAELAGAAAAVAALPSARALADLSSKIAAIGKNAALYNERKRAGEPAFIVANTRPAATPAARRASAAVRADVVSADGNLAKGERVVLLAIAQRHTDGVDRDQLVTLTGYKRRTRDAYLQRLRLKGYIEEASPGRDVATSAGIAALGPYEPLPTGDALRLYHLQRLPEGERVILELLTSVYPSSVPRDDIDRRTGYARRTRDAYLQRLMARRLVVCDREGVHAHAALFG